MTEPVIDQAVIHIFQGCLDTTTTIMAANDNVLDLENLDSIVNDRETIQVCVDYDICNIAMNKYFTRHQVHDLVCRNPAV